MKIYGTSLIFKHLLFWTISSLFINNGYASNTPELYISNASTNRQMSVKIYPVSMVFNGNEKYDLLCRNRENILIYNFINSRNAGIVNHGQTLWYNHDINPTNSANHGAIGFGVYKVEISVSAISFFDTCTIEWDIEWKNRTPPFGFDLTIYFRDDGNDPRVTFQWANGTETRIDDASINRRIQAWVQPGNGTRAKEYGDFHYSVQNTQLPFPPDRDYNFYTIFPQDSRRDCERMLFKADGTTYFASEPQAFTDNRSGDLTMNLTIDKKVVTPDLSQIIDYPTRVNVNSNVLLKLNDSDTIDFVEVNPVDPLAFFEMNVESDGRLLLNPNSKIIIRNKNRLNLNSNSRLYYGNGAEIRVKPGGLLCNLGASIRGNGRIIYEGGIHYSLCTLADYLLQDSVKFILDTNAVLSIPNNTTLHLKGNTTSLIMKPNSKLMFGENSGIVCDSGAKIIANNATFTSIDSTKKWNGISLSHLSQDTLKNCVIKNAMYGITISNKYSSSESAVPYSAEISGCTFVNQTNYVLNNGVYIAGCNHILIMNNTITSNALAKGFTHGIYAEYCPQGNFNIIGNTINNSNSGMTLIQCSPYIARNTLNGNAYVEMGFFLDNSNGTFEYNVVNDFYFSYYSFYSSPDLLKNTFNNSYDENIYLSSYSVPIMHPLISEGSIYWFSGDNLITGSPSDAGIFFDEDAYPDMESGYNRIELTNNTYYINGAYPSSLDGKDFNVIDNYWGGTPNPNKFNVTNAPDVIYDPYNDNSTGGRTASHYNLYDIGFGKYDSVFFDDGDNPVIVQELYLEAYQKEYSGQFSDAIETYKEIVSDYKDSSYASSCLSRIFNCYEKKSATISEFSALQSYYANILNDTSYSEIQRNISEDFMIKSKVKQNNIEEAIDDYNTIYNQNINSPKGIHALINREILAAGLGDNTGNNSELENLKLSQIRINEILGNIVHKKSNILANSNNSPESFSLSQNYPNPFNPTTSISFTIATNSFVTMKVFDITGKEIKILVNDYRQAGNYNVTFDAVNLPSGVYYYRLSAGQNVSVKRMVLLK